VQLAPTPVRKPTRRKGVVPKRLSANAAPGVHVTWGDQLTELRRFAGPGAVVGIGATGIMLDRIGQPRRTWPDYEAALAELTAP
jgi:hypothetical protein